MASSQHQHLRRQVRAVAKELSKLTIACDIDLDQQNLWERILRNDKTVCGRRSDKAFEQIKQHLMAIFPIQGQAVEDIGARATEEILDEVRTAIAELRLAGSQSATLPPKYKKK